MNRKKYGREDLVEGIHWMKMMDDVRLHHVSFDTLFGGWKGNDSFHYAKGCADSFRFLNISQCEFAQQK